MSASSSHNSTVAALCFPEITHKIQAELDSVVGRNRLPMFSDERLLPFLGAFIKEVTRRVLVPYFEPAPLLTPAIA
jgi:hypothetical protein